MDFMHRPKSKMLKIFKNYKLKSQRFGSWLCFHPRANGGEEQKNNSGGG
jgi:hypothetical protein